MSSIVVENVTLDYLLKVGSTSLKQTMVKTVAKLFHRKITTPIHNSYYRALNNLNLTIEHGDRIGLIGRNGAGKSTLLRTLAGIYRPTLGQINVEGYISTLLDVNLGMNIEASGYENIIILGVVRGKTKAEMLKKIPEIEHFTELGEFLSAPVRTYSSGMMLRLAFAIATAIDSDILLIDEIIGAGDAHFMEKAQERLAKLVGDSSILVLASHANEIIQKFCNKVLYLEQGNIKFFGSIDEGLALYNVC